MGFVERETTLIGPSPSENTYNSALLQLPGFFCQKKTVVEDAIHAMSLSDYANKLIGGHCYTKGIPNGERRRVSIARELVMRPHILFIDEPLYHLDSVSALLMMVTLKKLASTGFTLIFTIYQSSTEYLASLIGSACYQMEIRYFLEKLWLACSSSGPFMHKTHFSNAGFPCPIMQSPSDHFLRAINTDFDRIIAMCKNWQDDHGDFSSVNMDTAVAIRTLEATYKSSADAAAVETMILKLTEKEGSYLKSKGKASSATRIAVLTWRSLLIMSREWKYYWLRLIICMLLTLCIGTVFSGLGHSLSSVVLEGNLLVNKALGKGEMLHDEGQNALHEKAVWCFVGGDYVNHNCIRKPGCKDQVVMMLSAGYLRIRNALPGPVWTYPISYIAFHTYSIQARTFGNEYLGTSFAVGEVRTISGIQALRSAYDISSNSNSKWENLLVLFLMAIAYRILVLLVLHFRVGKNESVLKFCRCNQDTNNPR
ncbi:hypothetical protein GH714_014774 [Hevea brasiliensis]|uniref:ABC transporter domain-containing protein n=1 Tax=Hevea brasiliensis TaxID=3981 RepID=A0A6A6KUD8_HEVBR|nr:hypothetical protein GH714_014774 [Hevea brasiliensis]